MRQVPTMEMVMKKYVREKEEGCLLWHMKDVSSSRSFAV
jgi:hypothetical protein